MNTTAPPIPRDSNSARNEGPSLALNEVLEGMPVALVALDRDWRISHVNPEAERLLGRDAAEIRGQRIWQALPELAVAPWEDALRRAADRQEVATFQARYPDTETRLDVRVQPGSAGLLVYLKDVTRDRLAEAELRGLITSARCIVWRAAVERLFWGLSWDIHILDEEAAQRWLPIAVPPGESFTEAWYHAKRPEDLSRLDDVSRAALLSGQSQYNQEYVCRLENGEECWLAEAVQVEPLGPDRWHLVGVCTDITERKRAEAEREALYARVRNIAVTLQDSLTRKPEPDAFPGLDVAALYATASDEAEVGGDFCDAFRLDGDRVALVIGDVVGKGLAAAVHTAEVRYALRGFLREYPYPASALARLNTFLCNAQRLDDLDEKTLVCLALAVVECDTGRVTASAAGIEPPLVVRAGGAAEALAAGGLPLGALPRAAYVPASLTLAPGDLVLLATDGITEARRGKTFLGYDGLVDLVARRAADATALEVARQVLDGARAFAGGRLGDDACLLLARRAGSGGAGSG